MIESFNFTLIKYFMPTAPNNLHNQSSAFISSLKGNRYPLRKTNTSKKPSCLLVNPNIVAKELIKKTA